MENIDQFVNLLKERKITVFTAESCTGGLIAKLITDVPGSSEIFIGGIVSYSNDMKEKLLGVKRQTLEKYGAVSDKTVCEMLAGITKIANTDLAVAVSGIAGPGGGTVDKPVGTVYIGVNYRNKKLVQKYLFKGTRSEIRNQSVEKFIEIALALIENVRTKSPFL